MVDTESFWSQIGAYNEATWPLQVVLVIAALVLTYLVYREPGKRSDVAMKAFLAAAFAWNGIAFFLLFARNPIAMFVGAPLFLVLALLFAADIYVGRTEFRFPDAAWQQALTIILFLLVILYPVVGLALGREYPLVCTPVMPCPLTVFALALVVAAIPRADKRILVFLLPWALLGLPKCLGAADCREDCILFAAGVYGLIMLIRRWSDLPPLLEWGKPS